MPASKTRRSTEPAPSRSRRSSERRDARALEQSRRVVEAARALVDEGGLEAVTLRPLLAASGLSRQAFYECYRGMDDVLVALFADTLAKGAPPLRRRIAAAPNPVEQMRALIRAMASIARNPAGRTYMVAMTSERARLAETRPEALREACKPVTDIMVEILTSGVADGSFREDDPVALAETLHAIVSAEIHRNLHLARRARDRDWIERLCNLCLRGIAAR